MSAPSVPKALKAVQKKEFCGSIENILWNKAVTYFLLVVT